MDTKQYVTYMLKNYLKLKSEVDLIKTDMVKFKGISYDEMIETLNYAKPEVEGSSSGGISDKTGKIALTYKETADKYNAEMLKEICTDVYDRQMALERLEYYISRLDDKRRSVLQGIYIENHSWEDISDTLFISRTMLNKYRNEAINDLTHMYTLCGVRIPEVYNRLHNTKRCTL